MSKSKTKNAKKKPMYALKLSFKEYRAFGQFMTDKDPSHGNEKRYRLKKKDLETAIENELDQKAKIYTNCDGTNHPFNKNTDKIKCEKDKQKKTTVSCPVEICEDTDGKIDLEYLKDYVRAIKGHSEEDGAWALLGMYFLSRCR